MLLCCLTLIVYHGIDQPVQGLCCIDLLMRQTSPPSVEEDDMFPSVTFSAAHKLEQGIIPTTKHNRTNASVVAPVVLRIVSIRSKKKKKSPTNCALSIYSSI